MVSLPPAPPAWAEVNANSTPAVVQVIKTTDSENQGEDSPSPEPKQPQSDNSANLETARDRVDRHLRQIVEAQRTRQQQKQSTAPPVVSVPQPIPSPSPLLGSSTAQTKPFITKASKNRPVRPAAAPVENAPVSQPAPAPRTVEAIPFAPEPIGVLPQIGAFCSIAPESSRPKPAFLSHIAQLGAGLANFLHVAAPPTHKVQGQAIDLRTLKGSARTNCGSVGKLGFPLASPAPITSGFGWRIHPIMGTQRHHSGIDFGAAFGTIVRAAHSGTVIEAGDAGDSYGGKVVLETPNGNEQTLYAHLASLGVRSGQRVAEGQAIGRVGSSGLSTGPHLHFEKRIRIDGGGWQAIDPLAGH